MVVLALGLRCCSVLADCFSSGVFYPAQVVTDRRTRTLAERLKFAPSKSLAVSETRALGDITFNPAGDLRDVLRMRNRDQKVGRNEKVLQ